MPAVKRKNLSDKREIKASPGPSRQSGGEPDESESSSRQIEIARRAWKYFAANYLPETGMTNPVHNYSSGTLWDAGSALAAYVSAEKLGLIGRGDFVERAGRLLKTLLSMGMYNDELPNREYDWRTAGILDLRGKPSLRGSGWSALDLGRLLVWLKITESWYPELAGTAAAVVNRWKFERVCLHSELNGVLLEGSREHLRQEGRLGYEQYAASGFALWSREVGKAFDYEHAKWVELEGIRVPIDSRCYPYLTSEPFFLARMELGGLDDRFNSIIDDIYGIQKKRRQRTGILTAVTEDSINSPPWFVYNCIVYDGKPWTCLAHNGKPYDEFKNLSTKAAMCWSAIYSDDYSKELRRSVLDLADPNYGYYGGVYETPKGRVNRSLNLNTNAVILESMLYLQRNRKPFVYFHPGAK